MAGQGRDDVQDQGQGTTGKAMKRRGILAAAGAVVAGIVAKQVSQPVAAITGTNASIGFYAAPGTFPVGNLPTGTIGIAGSDSPDFSNSGAATTAGVMGIAHTTTGYYVNAGVFGRSTSTGNGVSGNSLGGNGVLGTSYTGTDGVGVSGASDVGTGVEGAILNGSAANTVAVKGTNSSTGAGGVGVQGVGGLYGVVGVASNQGGAAGVLGYTSQPNGVAFASVVTAPATLAGYFNGIVHVTGPFVVDNPANKHGAIDAADGTTRLVYSMESPESWIEDFGTGTLANGRAEIKLDAGFAGVVHTDDYHVFLTAHDEGHHLAVTSRAGAGFSVRASASAEAAATGKKAADLAGTFSYRVVAKPNVGRAVERLPKYTRPHFDMTAVERMAKAATAPAKPAGKP